MKRLAIVLIMGMISGIVLAQTPHFINYQAIVRDNTGESIANQTINIRISLLLGSNSGPVSYQETHQQTTNVFGLVNLAIGNGTPVTGVYDTVSWSSHSYFIKVEVDPAGGTNYTDMGTVQLLAVPYALHAEDATSATASINIQDSDGETIVTTEITPNDNRIRFYTGGQERFRMTGNRMEIINDEKNIFIGNHSGENNAGGIGNVILGQHAGKYNTTGSYNTFIGDSTGTANSGGWNNTFVGAWSGTQNTTGEGNTFLGADAGEWNATGTRNVFIGWAAGFSSLEATRNTFVGTSAGINNTGSYNTFIGQASGGNNTGSSNVFIGRTAGYNASGSNKLYIANSMTESPLIYGEFDNQLLRFHAGRIEIRNPSENTIVGDYAGLNDNGSRNVYVGTRTAMSESSGMNNVMIGYRSGSANNAGDCNVLAGYQAGRDNTTGDYNVFLGWEAGLSNTTGHRNTFVGPNAGSGNTTGVRNVYIGLSAGAANSTGSYNTFVGRAAGMNNSSGNDNVFLGDMAGMNEQGSNKLYIANSETQEPLIYGDFIEKRVKLWANNLEVEGKTTTGDKFNVGGDDGISDTLFSITAFDFTNQKIRFRKQVIKGGITIELTGESPWMDEIDKEFLFCDDGVTDQRDGQHYESVLIGEQCWMAENLNVGAMIEGTMEQSDNGTIEKYCYDNSEENCNTWGGLYQWNEMMQHLSYPGSQGICPKGWHIPTDEEVAIMEGTVDGQYGVGDPEWDQMGWRGSDAGLNLRSATGWAESGNGTDAFGFHALPGGNWVQETGFSGKETSAFFWVFAPEVSGSYYFRHLEGSNNEIDRNVNPPGYAFSIRCIKGQGTEPPGLLTADVTAITGSTASTGGTVTSDGGDPVTARGVVWSTSANPTLSDNFTTDGSGTGDFESTVTGLENATRYFVRAYATNYTGTRYGNQLAFTTPGASCPGGSTVEWLGKTYNTVMVGSQCWLKENLDVGTMIEITLEQSNNGTIEKYCYGNDEENCNTYGGLYTWDEIMQYVAQEGAQGICPDGWHVPSDDEFKVLQGTVDGQYGIGDPVWEIGGFRGLNAGKNLKSTSTWLDNGNGTDAYGFTALGTGYAWVGNSFGYINKYGIMWSSSEIQGSDEAWDIELFYTQDGIERFPANKTAFGLSVRCLNNETSLPMVTTADVTGITPYSAVSGGNVTSMGDNLVTARGVVWNTSGSPTLNDNFTTDGSGTGEFISNLTGLDPNTQYYVRAYATNNIATVFGSQIMFITDGEPCPDLPTVIWEGQTYHTVLIGDQCWLEENLNIGTMIEGTMEQSDNETIEKYCYEDNEANCDAYGAFYQWNEAMQYNAEESSQGICPDGWHIPTDEELKVLEGTADTEYGVGDPVWDNAGCRGNDAGTHLKSLSGWPDWCAGDNLSGFNALPAGTRSTDGAFSSLGEGMVIWSSSQRDTGGIWPRSFPCHMGGLCRDYDDEHYGFAIRCIKN